MEKNEERKRRMKEISKGGLADSERKTNERRVWMKCEEDFSMDDDNTPIHVGEDICDEVMKTKICESNQEIMTKSTFRRHL